MQWKISGDDRVFRPAASLVPAPSMAGRAILRLRAMSSREDVVTEQQKQRSVVAAAPEAAVEEVLEEGAGTDADLAARSRPRGSEPVVMPCEVRAFLAVAADGELIPWKTLQRWRRLQGRLGSHRTRWSR